MKIRFLIFGLLLYLNNSIYACGGIDIRVYAGDISYSINPNNPLNCSATITLDFDIPDSLPTDSIYFDWGDGTFNAVYATSITADSNVHFIPGVPVLYKHVYTGSHTYNTLPSTGYYLISPLYQYRLNYASNIIGGQLVDLRFYVQAQVSIDTTSGFINNSPVWNAPYPQFAFTHTTFNQPLPFTNTDGDSIVFDLLPPLVNNNVEAPAYLYPNQFCQNYGQSSSLSINPLTGEITWSSPCSQGIFTLTRIAKKYRNGRLLGSTISDQNIYVSNFSDITNPASLPAVQVYPSPTSSLINIKVTEPSLIAIYDMLGNLILKKEIQSSQLINVSEFNSGVYFVYENQNNYITKFVKQ